MYIFCIDCGTTWRTWKKKIVNIFEDHIYIPWRSFHRKNNGLKENGVVSHQKTKLTYGDKSVVEVQYHRNQLSKPRVYGEFINRNFSIYTIHARKRDIEIIVNHVNCWVTVQYQPGRGNLHREIYFIDLFILGKYASSSPNDKNLKRSNNINSNFTQEKKVSFWQNKFTPLSPLGKSLRMIGL